MDPGEIASLVGLGVLLFSGGIAWGNIRTRLNILWRAWEKSVDSRHANLFEHSSPRKLSQEGERMLPQTVRDRIDLLAAKGTNARAILGKVLDELEGEEMIVAARVYIEQTNQANSDKPKKRLWPFKARA